MRIRYYLIALAVTILPMFWILPWFDAMAISDRTYWQYVGMFFIATIVAAMGVLGFGEYRWSLEHPVKKPMAIRTRPRGYE